MLDVTLTEGIFKKSEATGLTFLLDLDIDRLIAPCYIAAGLKPKKPRYGGWESMEIAGHSLGHYLSAASIMYKTTKHPVLKERIDYAIMELSDLQAQSEDGYVSGFKRDCFDEVFTGEFRVAPFSLGGSWVPWYSIHKIYQGLIDVYHFTGLMLAKKVVYRLANWAERGLKKLSDASFQRMLICEFGGMNEVFADMYLLTNEVRFLELAERFQHQIILEPLSKGIDDLAGKHANTQIPKLIGTAKLYQITKKERYKKSVMFFYREVMDHRSYVIGGNSIGEHFGPSGTEPLGILTTETCNTYNMMKLSAMIFEWDQQSQYYDDYERALYNHILASQDPISGGKTYFVATEPGHFKVYCDKEDSFWCCTGTGMENPARYWTDIFKQIDDTLYVNLFISARVTLEEAAIQFQQTTAFPFDETVRLSVSSGNGIKLTVKVRQPAWISEPMTVAVNNQVVSSSIEAGYITIKRTWYEGDELTWRLPQSLHIYHNKDAKEKVAFMYGPLVLAAALGKEQYPETDIVGDHQIYNHHPLIHVPPLITDEPLIDILTCMDEETLTFRSLPVVGETGECYTFKPFFMIHHERYALYVDVLSEEAARTYTREAEELKQLLLLKTVDYVTPGEQQPETDHHLVEVHSRMGYVPSVDRHWRDAYDHGYFSYRLKTAATPLLLRVTYFGGDDNVYINDVMYPRLFDILVDGISIQTVHLQSEAPGELVERDYVLPEQLTKGKQHLEVTFQSRKQTVAGGIYGVRLLKREAE
ncbi:glycosyl hydrolase [Halolactibacillus alkaliphilus]|uniref:Glycosyl hydrolase n=1 Tax=Halolactibacillus alkaliphilus TaxID=442899 RepID=A0A511X1N9_9BACI|nr:beta-L-arabinofuranosidase domain-containing protein [Halolactibacillus alkaliphilus]GEN56869.1 glycosyl hydrolase [Halolactibacillus alkaliphilus]GGN71370.1 glycosyl hydrolase [Halolactibacillus alkaliphilus]SFO82425.1 hypothetical protein SAMN05720591_11436 [Halolactibacillus alkaliphilus]